MKTKFKISELLSKRFSFFTSYVKDRYRKDGNATVLNVSENAGVLFIKKIYYNTLRSFLFKITEIHPETFVMTEQRYSAGFGAWHLPTRLELDAIHDNLFINNIGGFSSFDAYWSGEEQNSAIAYTYMMPVGEGWELKTPEPVHINYVRPCRTFEAAAGAYNLEDEGPAGGIVFLIEGTTYHECWTVDLGRVDWYEAIDIVEAFSVAFTIHLLNFKFKLTELFAWKFAVSDYNPPAIAADLKDKDGNIYTTVIIGHQKWIVENFKCTKFADGSAIPKITDNTDWGLTELTSAPAYCEINNDGSYNDEYGLLYNYYAAVDPKDIAYLEIDGDRQAGWRVPTYNDFVTLVNAVGGIATANNALKETGTAHWTPPNAFATNSSGFSARGSGYRSIDGNFYNFLNHESANFWTSTYVGPHLTHYLAEYAKLFEGFQNILLDNRAYTMQGLSIRLVKDI